MITSRRGLLAMRKRMRVVVKNAKLVKPEVCAAARPAVAEIRTEEIDELLIIWLVG